MPEFRQIRITNAANYYEQHGIRQIINFKTEKAHPVGHFVPNPQAPKLTIKFLTFGNERPYIITAEGLNGISFDDCEGVLYLEVENFETNFE